MLSLDPPIEVLAVLLKEDGDVNPRAYIDELMSY
jgi:DNA polymerase delta subunit 4